MNQAAQIEMRKRYGKVWGKVWEELTTLGQIVTEDFPDPEKEQGREIARGDLDMLQDLAWRLEALETGYERR